MINNEFLALEIVKTVAWLSIIFVYKCFYLTRMENERKSKVQGHKPPIRPERLKPTRPSSRFS